MTPSPNQFLDDDDEDSFLRPQYGMMAPPANSPIATPPPPVAPQPTPTGLPPIDTSRAIAALDAPSKLGPRPTATAPKWWQRLAAGAAGGLGGYLNAAGTMPAVNTAALQRNILFPGLQQRQAEYDARMAQAQQQAQTEQQKLALAEGVRKEQTAEEKEAAQTKLLTTQEKTLTEEGKRAPKTNYITVPGGGLFNAETGQWVKQPIDKTQLIEVDPDWAKENAPYLKPDAQGSYTIPAVAMNSLITATQKEKPDKKLVFQHFTDENTGDVTTVGFDPVTGKEMTSTTIKGVAKKKAQPGVTLSPEAVQMFGQAAAQGLPLPSLGMGAAGAQARQQILNAAPQYAGGGTLAANRATTQANTASLGQMQKMRDSVAAFENTANANLDIFLKQAKPIIDSGSPIINQPLRSINRNLLGGADLAAYDAARQVALTEIAKVVNNPNLAGQLSDAGRKEVTSLVPENATLGQIYRVVGVLRQDMANRRQFLDQQLGEIKGRMGGAQQAAPAQGAAGSVVDRLVDKYK